MDLPARVQEVLAQFRIDRQKLEEIRDLMYREFKLGLEVGSPKSSVAMLPTYVPALPDGSGKFISNRCTPGLYMN